MTGVIVITLPPQRQLDSRVIDRLIEIQANTPDDWPISYIDKNPYGEPEDLRTKIKNIVYNLNTARKYFLESNFQYFLSIESDVIVPSFAVKEFIKAESDITVGIYRLHSGNLSCLKQEKNMDEIHPIPLTRKDLSKRFIPIDWFSFGCMLLKKEVLEEIEFEADFALLHDFAFSKRCKERGFKAICCTKVKCGHISPSGKILEV